MTTIDKKFFVRAFVECYVNNGPAEAGRYIKERFPENWEQEIEEWRDLIAKEFDRLGFELVDEEDDPPEVG